MTAGPKSENELARLLRPLQPFFEKHGSKMILGLAAVLLVAAAMIFWSRKSAADAAAGWGDLTVANGPEDFADVADENPGRPAAAWARLGEAHNYVARGVKASFTDREAAAGSYEKARDAYEKLLNKRGTPRDVRERALYGLARLEEAMSGEDVSTAIAAYEKVLSDFPDSVFKELVEARIEHLKDPATTKFYAWFHAQKPSVGDDLLSPKDVPGSPLPGTPGVTPPAPGDPEIPSTPVPGDPEEGPDGPKLPTPDSGGEADKAGGDADDNGKAGENGPGVTPPAGDAKSGDASGAGNGASSGEKSGGAEAGDNQEK